MWLVSNSSNPGGNRCRSYWYVAFAWFFTSVWVIVLVWTWLNYANWPIWARIAATMGLVLTTPAGSDLLLFVRLWRSRKKSETDT